MSASTTPAEPGRRERKKQRTREALIDAAFALFVEKGFEATTVEEIADAVDVSSRTFFRYFASKEDVVLSYQEEQRLAALAALASRPASEPVLTAMRHAMLEVSKASEEGDAGFDPVRFQCFQQIMSSSPAIVAGSMERARKKQEDFTNLIAARMGVDPETDVRPHVVSALVMCIFHAAHTAVESPTLGYGSLTDAIGDVIGCLEEGVNYPSVPQAGTCART